VAPVGGPGPGDDRDDEGGLGDVPSAIESQDPDPDEPSARQIRDLLHSQQALRLLKRLHHLRVTDPDEEIQLTVSECRNEFMRASLNYPDSDAADEDTRREAYDCLHKWWLPLLDTIGAVFYDDIKCVVSATPVTTLYTIVINPRHLQQRNLDRVASQVAWLTWRDEEAFLDG